MGLAHAGMIGAHAQLFTFTVIIPILWMRLPDLRAKFAWEKWGDADLVSSRAAR